MNTLQKARLFSGLALAIGTMMVGAYAYADAACVKVPPGHLITRDWVKLYGNADLCKPLPPGIAKKIADLKKPIVPPDRKAPDLFAPTANAGVTTATIMWVTDEPSTSMVAYSTLSPVFKASPGTRIASDMTLTTFHTITLTGLSSGTTYYYKVYSRDAAGNQGKLAEHSFTTTSPDMSPPQIFAPTVSVVTQSSATISWLTDEEATGKVTFSKVSPLSLTAATTLSVSSSALEIFHSLTLTGLASGTTYYYIIESTDVRGQTDRITEHSFTTVSGAPDVTSPTISAIASSTSSSGATITWTTNEMATSKVFYGTGTPLQLTSSATLTVSQNALVTNHALALTGLTPNTRYYLVVESRDASGNASLSQEFSIMTSPL